VSLVLLRSPTAGEAVIIWTRLLLGLAAIGGDAVADAVGRAMGSAPPPAPRLLTAVAGAGVGLCLEAQRRALATAGRVSAALPRFDLAARTGLGPWYRRGVEEQRGNRELADRFLRALVASLTRSVLAELDVDAVADRIDLDRIVDRIDLDAILLRVDMEGLIRESTSTMVDESVDALRVQGMNADRLVSRVVDRLLRRGERQTSLDGG